MGECVTLYPRRGNDTCLFETHQNIPRRPASNCPRGTQYPLTALLVHWTSAFSCTAEYLNVTISCFTNAVDSKVCCEQVVKEAVTNQSKYRGDVVAGASTSISTVVQGGSVWPRSFQLASSPLSVQAVSVPKFSLW